MKQGSDNKELVRLFGSVSRVRILALLSDHPHQPFYQRQIVFGTGLSLQAVQRELRNLVSLGILKRTGANHRVYYEINPASSLFKPLREICALSEKG